MPNDDKVLFPFPPLPPWDSPEARAERLWALGPDLICPNNKLVRMLKRKRNAR